MLQFVGGLQIIVVLMVALASALAIRKRSPALRVLTFALFSIYISEVVRLTLFPIPIDGSMKRAYAQAGIGFSERIELNPLAFLTYDSHQLLGNLALAAPFGFLLPFLWPALRGKAIVLCLTIPLGIELLQLAISGALGFMYRTFDLGDLVLNTFGAVLALSLGNVVSHRVRPGQHALSKPLR